MSAEAEPEAEVHPDLVLNDTAAPASEVPVKAKRGEVKAGSEGQGRAHAG